MSPKPDQGVSNTPPWVSLLSGGVAGGVEAAATYPFEFAKTRVQLQSTATNDNLNPRNPFRVVSHVFRTEGAGALYKGCSALVVGSIAKDGIRFLFFDAIKDAFKDKETGALTPLRSMLAGMTAGVVSSTFASTPSERLKTALIDDARGRARFHGSLHALRVIYHEHGLPGLYRGFLGTTLRQSLSTAIRLSTYSVLKDYENARGVTQSTATNFGNGAVAGLTTTLTTQPFDVVKTRAQSARGATTLDAFRSVVRDGGVAAFWRGTGMRLGRTVVSGGILFTVYERVAGVLGPLFR